MDAAEARTRFERARVGRLATVTAEGRPHVVPFVFVLSHETIYWAVDHKPKRTEHLKRLDNIRANEAAEVLVDDYDENWTRLWWVRATGSAREVDDDGERDDAVHRLMAKFSQYQNEPPAGSVVAIDVTDWSWWSAT